MYSKERIFGHPVHPMLISFPIASFVFALVSLIAFGASRDPFWFTASYWLSIVGVGTGLLAAVFGLVDWLGIPSDAAAKAVGLWHMLLNVTIVGLYFIAWLSLGGLNGPLTAAVIDVPVLIDTTVPLLLQLVGTLLLVTSGWLGGHLIYRHHVAIEPVGAEEAALVDDFERGRRAA